MVFYVHLPVFMPRLVTVKLLLLLLLLLLCLLLLLRLLALLLYFHTSLRYTKLELLI